MDKINNILILDDSKERHHTFNKRLERFYPEALRENVYNYKECINAFLIKPKFDLVYLDHDLGELDTGTDVCNWMRDFLPKDKIPSKIIIHSWNFDGAMRMLDILNNNNFNASRQPFR